METRDINIAKIQYEDCKDGQLSCGEDSTNLENANNNLPKVTNQWFGVGDGIPTEKKSKLGDCEQMDNNKVSAFVKYSNIS